MTTTVLVRIFFTGLMVLVPIKDGSNDLGMWALLLQTTQDDVNNDDDIESHEPRLRYDCGNATSCARSCKEAGGEMDEGNCSLPIDQLDLELGSPVPEKFVIKRRKLDKRVYSLRKLGLKSVQEAQPDILKRADKGPPLEGKVSARMWVANGEVTARRGDTLKDCSWKLARRGSPGSFGFRKQLARRVLFSGRAKLITDDEGSSHIEIAHVNNRNNSNGATFRIPTFGKESVEIWIVNDPTKPPPIGRRFLPHFKLFEKISAREDSRKPFQIPHRRCRAFPGLDTVICPGAWDDN